MPCGPRSALSEPPLALHWLSPPSTTNSAPVENDESSLARKTTSFATAAVHSSALVTSRWTYVAGGPIF
jgi:hypothetical protein